jgi:hypothetical protein
MRLFFLFASCFFTNADVSDAERRREEKVDPKPLDFVESRVE